MSTVTELGTRVIEQGNKNGPPIVTVASEAELLQLKQENQRALARGEQPKLIDLARSDIDLFKFFGLEPLSDDGQGS